MHIDFYLRFEWSEEFETFLDKLLFSDRCRDIELSFSLDEIESDRREGTLFEGGITLP